jgi:hypothetical protein
LRGAGPWPSSTATTAATSSCGARTNWPLTGIVRHGRARRNAATRLRRYVTGAGNDIIIGSEPRVPRRRRQTCRVGKTVRDTVSTPPTCVRSLVGISGRFGRLEGEEGVVRDPGRARHCSYRGHGLHGVEVRGTWTGQPRRSHTTYSSSIAQNASTFSIPCRTSSRFSSDILVQYLAAERSSPCGGAINSRRWHCRFARIASVLAGPGGVPKLL